MRQLIYKSLILTFVLFQYAGICLLRVGIKIISFQITAPYFLTLIADNNPYH